MPNKRYIVSFKDNNIRSNTVAEILKKDSSDIEEAGKSLSVNLSNTVVHHFTKTAISILHMADNEASDLQGLPEVDDVIEDFAIYGHLDVEPEQTEAKLCSEEDFVVTSKGQKIPKNIHTVGADLVWPHATGKSVKVAVLDTGIYLNHPDLTVRDGISFVDGICSWDDDGLKGHGTHCAGIIGAHNNPIGIIGIAPDCLLYSVKILDKHQKGCLSSLLAGLEWAADKNMDVVSISARWTDTQIREEGKKSKEVKSLQRHLRNLENNNCVVVAAAGNSEKDPKVVYEPALAETVIAVGATNKNKQGQQYTYHSQEKPQRAPFSCWQPGGIVDLCAPGVDIYSTWNESRPDTYGHKTGTSESCPHVAGAAALLKELHPDWTAAQVRQAIIHSASDIGSPGCDDQTGFGLLDCFSAAQIT